jgi:hypothetical protein
MTAIPLLVGTCLIPDHPYMFLDKSTGDISCCSSSTWDKESCYAGDPSGDPCAVGANTADAYYCCGIKDDNSYSYVTCSDKVASECNHEYCDKPVSTGSCPIPNFQNRYVFTEVGLDDDNPAPSSTYTVCMSDNFDAYTFEPNDACAVATSNRRCCAYSANSRIKCFDASQAQCEQANQDADGFTFTYCNDYTEEGGCPAPLTAALTTRVFREDQMSCCWPETYKFTRCFSGDPCNMATYEYPCVTFSLGGAILVQRDASGNCPAQTSKCDPCTVTYNECLMAGNDADACGAQPNAECSAEDSGGGLSPGAIAGIAIGALAAIALAALAIL